MWRNWQRRGNARTIGELIQAQQRTEERLARLEAAVMELVEAQKRMVDEQQHMRTEIGTLRGFYLEYDYARKATGYFGRWLRRVRRILPDALDPAVEDHWEASLTDFEYKDLLQSDIVLSGRLREPHSPDKTEIWLAVEVSVVIDRGDVERAWRRAGWLRKAGYPAIGVVAGESVTQGATTLINEKPVAILLDGRDLGWSEALNTL